MASSYQEGNFLVSLYELPVSRNQFTGNNRISIVITPVREERGQNGIAAFCTSCFVPWRMMASRNLIKFSRNSLLESRD
jgi:hypothetical protein